DCVTRKLPNGICLALEDILENTLSNRLDWGNMEVAQPIIASMLSQMVEALNGLIGEAVQKLCRHPNALREEQARALVESEKYRERLLGAFNRSTLAAALVNVTHQFMWAVGVGDSSAALSIADPDGSRRAHRLCDMHTLKDPQEYFRAWMCHGQGETDIIEHDLLLQLPSPYLQRLFRFLPYEGHADLTTMHKRIKTPPYYPTHELAKDLDYVIATPSVQSTDLRPFRDSDPLLMLFSDDVDHIINGYFVFGAGTSGNGDACEVVSKLLQDCPDPSGGPPWPQDTAAVERTREKSSCRCLGQSDRRTACRKTAHDDGSDTLEEQWY
ncbi:hypothetical protein BD310DRAFT_1029655, partial [Dichomitus squalens]